MSIGERIKYVRESKNISQRELADMIHISPSFLCRIENGSSMPNIDCICSIAKALDSTPQNILCDIFVYSQEMTVSDQIKNIAEQFPIDQQLIILEVLQLISPKL